MKKNKLLFTLLIFTFIGMLNVKAATLTHPENKITYGNVTIYDKKLDGKEAFCLSGVDVKAADSGTVCTSKNSLKDLDDRLMIGEIIAQECAGTATECYVTREIAILSYLKTEIGSPDEALSNKVKALKNAASSSSNKSIYESSFEISLIDTATNKSVTTLNFVVDGEYYKSQTMKVSADYLNSVTQKTVTGVSGATVEGNDSSFYVKVPINKVKSVSTITLKVDAKQQPYNIAELYTCGSGVQDIAQLTTGQRSKSKSLSGTITPKGILIINKYDNKNVALSGATIKVTGTKGYSHTFVTNGAPYEIYNLDYDTYTIEEVSAPAGYVKVPKQTVPLTESKFTATVNLENNKTKITIIKLDDDGVTKLQGANLKLVDANGNTINSCPDERSKSFLCEWTSSQTDKVIEGLPAGTYYLVEESAPKGYNLKKEKIKIEISENGKITVDGKESADGIINFYNSLTKVEISKISTTTGKELPGATLQILNSNEKEIPCKIKDKNGKIKTLDKCTWVSGEENVVVVGLLEGEYYLVEKTAPEGYELNEEKIKFEIKADGSTTKVEMKNNLIVKVPDTLSSRSSLLIAISMFDIALGIGIVTYVKKNKVKE